MHEDEPVELARRLLQIVDLLEDLICLLETRLPRPTYPAPTGMQITVRS
jgi:hypothetical protein